MRAARCFAIAALLLLGGCNELLNVDRFRVGDAAVDGGRDAGLRDGGMDGSTPDGGPPDAGPPDAGPCNEDDPDADGDGFDSVACGGRDCDDGDRDINPDATEVCDDVDDDCDPSTLGPDGDGDGFAPPECCNGGVCGADCADEERSIRPGATEVCDDVDQDCDGAVDETLLTALGTPVLVEPDFGLGPGQGAIGVAHSEGFAVVWKADEFEDLQARFFRRDGTVQATLVVEAGSTLEARDPRSPRATLLERAGLEQVYVTWLEQGTDVDSRGVYASICEVDGSDCGVDRRIVDVDPRTVSSTALLQAGDRVIFAFLVNDRDLHVHAIDPRGLTPASTVVVPGIDGGETAWGPPAYITGPQPQLLFTRSPDVDLSMVPDGGTTLDGGAGSTYAFGRGEVVRVRLGTTLSHVPAEDIFDWDFTDACRATGRANCGLFSLLAIGQAPLDEPGFLGVEAVAGFDSLDGGAPSIRLCGYPLTARADRAPDRGTCSPVDSVAFFADDRGSVATTAVFSGTRYAVRDLPLTPDTEGSSLVPVPGMDLLLPGTTRPLSMRGGHGILVGNGDAMGGFDVYVQRLGCEP